MGEGTSLGDILVLFGLFRPFKWVSKDSVFKVPFVRSTRQ